MIIHLLRIYEFALWGRPARGVQEGAPTPARFRLRRLRAFAGPSLTPKQDQTAVLRTRYIDLFFRPFLFFPFLHAAASWPSHEAGFSGLATILLRPRPALPVTIIFMLYL
uniref:Uncharacterized protein n=1 Tax=Phlegmariurus squarrosus TaxID=73615 RepID=H9M825_PHLSQ|nr:hypothetical protein HusqMp14 [Phlegmariurus squarrosus]AEV55732.1 hypothetical protein HusqMp14 [Phlegmariurus squarrosus]